jgi:hypothetical protein
MPPTRRQKRWSSRLRTAGALLLLIGAVGLVDQLLPGAREGLWPARTQSAVALAVLALGLLLFTVGRRWT